MLKPIGKPSTATPNCCWWKQLFAISYAQWENGRTNLILRSINQLTYITKKGGKKKTFAACML